MLIAGERRGVTVKQVMVRVRAAHGNLPSAISAISIVELTHGIYRAQTESHQRRRMAFVDELCQDTVVHPVTLEIARLAGRIEGEQAAKGIIVAVEDLLIGATALHLGFDVATLNVRHFQQIPNLNVVTL